VPFAKTFVALIVLYITGVIEYGMFNHSYILFFPMMVSVTMCVFCAWHMYQNYKYEEIPEETFTFAMHVCVGMSVINNMKLNIVRSVVDLILVAIAIVFFESALLVIITSIVISLMLFMCKMLLRQCNMQYTFEEIAE
jgi:hypothetical protein